MDFFKNLFDDLFELGHNIVVWLVTTIGKLGYAGVLILMGIESSFIPFPSEVIVPPAGYLVSQGQMNMVIVIICGIIGSIAGALVNYWLAAKFGRTFLLKYSKYFFLNEEKFDKFEKFFHTHGDITTFVGRLIPGVRQYISFPAGLVRMNLPKFITYTALGAGIWVVILAYVGYFVGNNIDLVKTHTKTITLYLFPILILMVIMYVIVHRRKNSNKGA